MLKKIISIVLCICIVAATGMTAFAQAQYPQTVPEKTMKAEGVGQFIGMILGCLNPQRIFPHAKKLCPIPELDKGFIPQGFCYIDSKDAFAITCYSDDGENSILSIINAKNGERAKTVKLYYADGSACTSHVGGVADIGDSLLVASGSTVRRVKLSDIDMAADYGEVRFSGTLQTNVSASYVAAYRNQLFVGEFYLYKSYMTDSSHHLRTPGGKNNYALCEVYDMSDLDGVFSAGSAIPEKVISMPEMIQGVAFDGVIFATSRSYALNVSTIRYYGLKPSGYSYNVKGTDVPLYFVEEKDSLKKINAPHMLEGIDYYNGKITGVFESSSKKYGFIKYLGAGMSSICTFE